MNKNEEQVIQYLSGELSKDELMNFETKLNNSSELQKLVADYSKVFGKVSSQKSIEGNYFYFENILQKFYNRKSSYSKNSVSRSFAYAAVLIVFVSAIYFFLSVFQTNEMSELETLTQEVSQDQLMELVNEYSLVDNSDLTSSNSSSIFDEEINSFYDNSIQNISDKLEISDLTDQLTESETDRIYSELLNKKIL